MMLIEFDRRHRIRYHEVKIFIDASSSQLFILHPFQPQLITKLLVFGLESVKFLTPIESSTTLPIRFRKGN